MGGEKGEGSEWENGENFGWEKERFMVGKG